MGIPLLTHWGRDKMAAISQTTFQDAFSWMKMHEFRLRFHWSLFLRFELTIFQHWFRQWLGADQATSHYLNQWWLILLTHICVTRPQWVKVKMVLTSIGIPMLKIRWSLDHLIFNMGIPILVRQHIHIEMAPRIFWKTRSITCLMMPWLFAVPSYQYGWYHTF